LNEWSKKMADQQIANNPIDQSVRESDGYRRAVAEVTQSQTLAYESSRDRATIIKINGERDARDNLRDSYNDLLKHMHDNPEAAAQDAAVLRSFQLASNKAAMDQHWSENQRDNALAGMLNAHVHGVTAEISIKNQLPEAAHER
jgi:hypothetical protein